jgi:hypothetical protein
MVTATMGVFSNDGGFSRKAAEKPKKKIRRTFWKLIIVQFRDF